MEALADGKYDVIIMETGLKECVISVLLSVEGKRVLQLDRNNYYGAVIASLNLTNLYEKFEADAPPSDLGANRDFNVNIIPKFIMACGNLTKMLLHTKVTRYLEFKAIEASFVYNAGKTLKVPATQFISHTRCLEISEDHMDQPALATLKGLQVYRYSLARHGTSPYIYPVYGLGGAARWLLPPLRHSRRDLHAQPRRGRNCIRRKWQRYLLNMAKNNYLKNSFYYCTFWVFLFSRLRTLMPRVSIS